MNHQIGGGDAEQQQETCGARRQEVIGMDSLVEIPVRAIMPTAFVAKRIAGAMQ